MLAGFEDPDEGEIRISGNAVQGVPPHKRDVNTVFQHYALFPHMTVAENVAYGLRQKKVDRSEIGRRVGEALEMVKMSKLANRKPRRDVGRAAAAGRAGPGAGQPAQRCSCSTSRSGRSTASSARRCRSS